VGILIILSVVDCGLSQIMNILIFNYELHHYLFSDQINSFLVSYVVLTCVTPQKNYCVGTHYAFYVHRKFAEKKSYMVVLNDDLRINISEGLQERLLTYHQSDHVNRRDGFSMKKPFLWSARGASFHTKHATNVNVVRVVLLDANSYLAYCSFFIIFCRIIFHCTTSKFELKIVYLLWNICIHSENMNTIICNNTSLLKKTRCWRTQYYDFKYNVFLPFFPSINNRTR
jgi:hypothetical protein